MSLSKGIYTHTHTHIYIHIYLTHPGIHRIVTIGFFTYEYPYATCHDAQGSWSHAIEERTIEAEHNGNGESTDRAKEEEEEEREKRGERRGRGLL